MKNTYSNAMWVGKWAPANTPLVRMYVANREPAMGAPTLPPTLRKTLFMAVAWPMSLGCTVRTRRLMIEAFRSPMPAPDDHFDAQRSFERVSERLEREPQSGDQTPGDRKRFDPDPGDQYAGGQRHDGHSDGRGRMSIPAVRISKLQWRRETHAVLYPPEATGYSNW